MVDRDGLENRCTRKGTVGSNPTLSAMSRNRPSRMSTSGEFMGTAPSPSLERVGQVRERGLS